MYGYDDYFRGRAPQSLLGPQGPGYGPPYGGAMYGAGTFTAGVGANGEPNYGGQARRNMLMYSLGNGRRLRQFPGMMYSNVQATGGGPGGMTRPGGAFQNALAGYRPGQQAGRPGGAIPLHYGQPQRQPEPPLPLYNF